MTYSPETPAYLSSLNDQRFYFFHLPSKKGKGYCRGQAAALRGKCMYRIKSIQVTCQKKVHLVN